MKHRQFSILSKCFYAKMCNERHSLWRSGSSFRGGLVLFSQKSQFLVDAGKSAFKSSLELVLNTNGLEQKLKPFKIFFCAKF
jgi:hypothetical protein